MNKWRKHIATGSAAMVLGVASMVPSLALAQASPYDNQDMNSNQMNGSPDTNSTGQMEGSGDNMGSGDSSMGSGMSQENMPNLSKQAVMQIQDALNQSGDQLAVDGIMGPRTEAALRKYQESHGLQPTGKPDPQTMQQLGIGQVPGE